MKSDKDLVDKSQDAFVSFIRYYKEHQLTFIFNFILLDIGGVANSFCLFKIPRVKEILGKQLVGFTQNNDVIIDQIPYKDKNKGFQKEEVNNKRKEKFAEKMAEREVERQEKTERIQALKKKGKEERSQQRTKAEKKVKKREIDQSQWVDHQTEERLYKKLKRGKISQAQYDELMGEGSL